MTRIGNFRMPPQPQKPIQSPNNDDKNKIPKDGESPDITNEPGENNPPPSPPINTYKDFMNYLASREFLTEVKNKGVNIESKEFREFMDNYVKTHPQEGFTPTTQDRLLKDILDGWNALNQNSKHDKNLKYNFNNEKFNYDPQIQSIKIIHKLYS